MKKKSVADSVCVCVCVCVCVSDGGGGGGGGLSVCENERVTFMFAREKYGNA